MSIAKPNSSQQTTAVKDNSKAEANVFRMEFRFFKKMLVTMPQSALLNITNKTVGSRSAAKKLSLDNALGSLLPPPCAKVSTTRLQIMESMYMYMFCGGSIEFGKCNYGGRFITAYLNHDVDIGGRAFQEVFVVDAGKTRTEYLDQN